MAQKTRLTEQNLRKQTGAHRHDDQKKQRRAWHQRQDRLYKAKQKRQCQTEACEWFFLIAIINDQEYLNLGLNTNLNKI